MLEAEEEDRRRLQLLLSQEGCQVAACSEPNAALRELDAREYDAVFCDLGIAASAEELSERLRRPDAPLLVVVAAPEDRGGAMAAVDDSAWDCLFKPAAAADVAVALRRIGKLLSFRRAQASKAPGIIRETEPPPTRPRGLSGDFLAAGDREVAP